MAAGGSDAFICDLDRIASRIGDRFAAVAGALSSAPERVAASRQTLGWPQIHEDLTQIAILEARLKIRRRGRLNRLARPRPLPRRAQIPQMRQAGDATSHRASLRDIWKALPTFIPRQRMS